MSNKALKWLMTAKYVIAFCIGVFVILSAILDVTALAPQQPTQQDTECECDQRTTSPAAIKAPLLTIGSVLILLVRIFTVPNIPPDHTIRKVDGIVNALVIPASVFVGVTAGWHWLSAETGGHPGAYLITLLTASAIITLGLCAWPIFDTLRDRPPGQTP